MRSVRAAVLGAVMAVSVGAGTALAQSMSPVRKDVRDCIATNATSCATNTRSDRTGETSAPTVAISAKTSGPATRVKSVATFVRSATTGSTCVATIARSSATDTTFASIGARSVVRSRRNRRSCCVRRRRIGRRLHPAAQDFRHAPGLRNAAARRVRRFGVENLADRSETERPERRDASVEKAARAGTIFGMQLEPRVHPRTDQPPQTVPW